MIFLPLGLFFLFGGFFLTVMFMGMMCDNGGVSMGIGCMFVGVILIVIDLVEYFILGNPAFDPFNLDALVSNMSYMNNTWIRN
jgi:hypothetical protein